MLFRIAFLLLLSLSAHAQLPYVMVKGAVCDGVTDDSAAINAALTALGTSGSNTGFYKVGNLGRLVFPNTGKGCVIKHPVLATTGNSGQNLYGAGFVFDMSGAALLCQVGPGLPCLDASGTGRATLLNVSVVGSCVAGQTPDYGLTIGRVANNGVGADNLHIVEPTIGGCFNIAPYLNNQSETTLVEMAEFSNFNPHAWAAIWDGENHWNFKTTAPGGPFPKDTPVSFNENTCIQCIVETSGVGSVPIWIGGTARHKFVNMIADSSPQSASSPGPLVVLYSGNGMSNPLLELDTHFEDDAAVGALNGYILFAGSANIVQNGLQVRDNYTEQSGPLFERDTQGQYGPAVQTVAIDNANLSIVYQSQGSAKWFDNPAAFTLQGHVAADNTWVPPGTFAGDLAVGSGALQYYASAIHTPSLVPTEGRLSIQATAPATSTTIDLSAPVGASGQASMVYSNSFGTFWQVGQQAGNNPAFFAYDVAGGRNDYYAIPKGDSFVATQGGNLYEATLTTAVVNAGATTLPQTTPASSSAPCTAGSIYADANFIYACTATNTWKRAPLGSF